MHSLSHPIAYASGKLPYNRLLGQLTDAVTCSVGDKLPSHSLSLDCQHEVSFSPVISWAEISG
jgi:hypothetical protein